MKTNPHDRVSSDTVVYDPNRSTVLPAGAYHDIGGLTKREYFAAMAMQGLLADPRCDGTVERITARAVDAADALIAELNKE